MGWGDRSFSGWGQVQWGEDVGFEISRWFGDVVTKSTDLHEYMVVDTVVALAATKTCSLDGVAKGDSTQRAYLDVYVSRLTTDLLSGTATKPAILVSLAFPSGTLRVSRRRRTVAGFGWAGSLLQAAEIERAFADRVDDMRLTIADVAPRVSDGFTDANPPEGAEVVVYALAADDPSESLIELFRGRVEQIVSVSEDRFSVEVVRADAVLDRTVGRLLDLTIAPGAPEEAIGTMIPHVYGEVAEAEALLTDYNPTSAIATPLTETTSSIIVRDGSGFSSAASGDIDDEIVSWTGKSGNELTGVTRGASGTKAAAHVSGSKLVERGTFVAKFADHAVTSIDEVKILGPDGNLATPETAPTIDTAAGTASWPQTPRITVPSRTTEVILVGFDTADGASTATNPALAAPEHQGADDLNYAQAGGSQTVILTRAGAVEDYGEIVRAGLVVSFDPSTAPGSTVYVNNYARGVISPSENLPPWALRRLQRHLKASYDLNDGGHTHSISGVRNAQVRPTVNVSPDKTVDPANGQWHDLHHGYDANGNTRANYREYQVVGGVAAAPFVVNGAALALAAGETVSRARLWMSTGGGTFVGDGPSAPIQLSLHAPGISLQGAINYYGMIQVLSSWGGPQVPTAYSSPWFTPPADVSQWPSMLWITRPDPFWNSKVGDTYCIRDMVLEVEIAQGLTNNQTGVLQRRSQVNYFDATGIITTWAGLAAASAKVVAGANGARINGIWWAVEVRPTTRTAIEVPRIFGRVRGIEPAGGPTEIAREIITAAAPRGLGLPSTSISDGDYASAQKSCADDGIRLDFAIRKRTPGLELLRKLANQADLRQVWDAGRHSLIRKPNVAALGDVFKAYQQADVIDLTRTREAIVDVANQFGVRYKFAARLGEFAASFTDDDAASQALFGLFAEDLDLDMVEDSATATLVSARKLARRALPRWLVTLDLPLFALELKRGDLIALTHNQLTFAKAEVLGLPIVIDEFISVRVSAVVWSVT